MRCWCAPAPGWASTPGCPTSEGTTASGARTRRTPGSASVHIGREYSHAAVGARSIHHLQCTAGCRREVWACDALAVRVDAGTMRAVPPLPECPSCGALARPNILMFGDFEWVPDRSQAQLDALAAWRREQRDLVVIEIGAGLAVPTVRRQAELCSAASGALVRINPREPKVRHSRGVSLPVGALEALTAIDARLR